MRKKSEQDSPTSDVDKRLHIPIKNISRSSLGGGDRGSKGAEKSKSARRSGQDEERSSPPQLSRVAPPPGIPAGTQSASSEGLLSASRKTKTKSASDVTAGLNGITSFPHSL